MPNRDYGRLDDFKNMAKARTALTLKMLGEPPTGVKITEMFYTTRDGHDNAVKLFQPETCPEEGSPLIVMFHGGGFCIGGPESEEQSCRNFVQAFGAVCVSAAYRLAPEWAFPYAIDDAWDAYRWAVEHAATFAADPSRGLVVGGTSAGANMSAVIAHLARDADMKPSLTGQYLAIPMVVPNKSHVPEKYQHMYLSMEQNGEGTPILPREAVETFMGAYKPDDKDSRFNVLGSTGGHANLPRTYLQVNGMDPLRDEALIYEKILREECGIQTMLDMYPGLPHGFWGFFPKLQKSIEFRKDMIKGMSWLLGRSADISRLDNSTQPASV